MFIPRTKQQVKNPLPPSISLKAYKMYRLLSGGDSTLIPLTEFLKDLFRVKTQEIAKEMISVHGFGVKSYQDLDGLNEDYYTNGRANVSSFCSILKHYSKTSGLDNTSYVSNDRISVTQNLEICCALKSNKTNINWQFNQIKTKKQTIKSNYDTLLVNLELFYVSYYDNTQKVKNSFNLRDIRKSMGEVQKELYTFVKNSNEIL